MVIFYFSIARRPRMYNHNKLVMHIVHIYVTKSFITVE